MKKIVVTGALGYIGSRLIREIPARFPGCEIVMIDRDPSGHRASLENLPKEGRYFFTEGDILDLDLGPFFKGADTVIHLAALSDPAESFKNPEETERVNILGTARVAEACLESGAALFFPSTTSVYGKENGTAFEDGPPEELIPQSPYADSKLKAENLLRSEIFKKLRFSIARFGTVFGPSPGMRFNTAVNKFCKQAAEHKPVTVWRTALDQTRAYLDLTDAVEVILFLTAKRLFDGQVYNAVTLNATVRQILSALKKNVTSLEIQEVDSPAMNDFSYGVSPLRLEKEGFSYQGDLTAGIKQVLEILTVSGI